MRIIGDPVNISFNSKYHVDELHEHTAVGKCFADL